MLERCGDWGLNDKLACPRSHSPRGRGGAVGSRRLSTGASLGLWGEGRREAAWSWAGGWGLQVPAWACGARGGGKGPGAGQGAGVGCSRVVPLAQAGGSAWKQEVSLF